MDNRVAGTDLETIFGPTVEHPPKAKSARLRALKPKIELARAQGYMHQEIVAFLNTRGFDIGYGFYRLILHRAKTKIQSGKKGAAKWSERQAPAKESKAPAAEGSKDTDVLGADLKLDGAVPQDKFVWDVNSPVRW